MRARERLARADDDGVRGRVRAEDVERPLRDDADALALPGGEAPEAVVPAQLAALLVHDRPVPWRQPVAAEERAVVVAGEEARLLALGALRSVESGPLRLRARLRLVLPAEREPDAAELRRVEAREHVRLVLRGIGAAVQEQPSAMLVDTRVVAGGEPVAAGAAGEREQLCEAEAAVAGDARIRRLAARVAAHERRHHCAPELFPEVERDMRQPQPVAGLACGDHRLGRAAGALRVRAVRVEPETKRHADGVRSRTEQRHRTVDAAAHRHRRPSGARLGAEDRSERRRERVDRERLAADGGRLEQRQSGQRALEPVGVRVDDRLAFDDEADRRPLAVPRRVSERLDHRSTVTKMGRDLAAPPQTPPCRSSPSYVNLANQVGAEPFVDRGEAVSVGTRAPFM